MVISLERAEYSRTTPTFSRISERSNYN